MLCGLGLVWGYAVFKYGGVVREDWDTCLIGIGLVTLLVLFPTRDQYPAPRLGRWLRWPLVLLPCYALLQVIPLPSSLLVIISPARAELLRGLHTVVADPDFGSLSVVPSETAAYLLRILAYIAVFLIVRKIDWRFEDRPWAVTVPIFVVAGLEAALGMWQYSIRALSAHGTPNAHGTYVNRDHYVGLLEMSLPFAVMLSVAILRKRREREHPSVWPAVKASGGLALAALMMVGIIYSFGRMGYIASLVSLFVVGVMAFGAGVVRWQKWTAVAVVVVFVVILFVFLPPDVLIGRFGNSLAGGSLDTEGRSALWRDALHLIAAYPVVGCGLGGYLSAMFKYQTALPLNTIDYAHNDVLQSLAELGVVGFSILATLLLTAFSKAVKGASQHASDYRYRAVACTGAMAAIFLHSLVDFSLQIPANGLLLAWICGIATRRRSRQ